VATVCILANIRSPDSLCQSRFPTDIPNAETGRKKRERRRKKNATWFIFPALSPVISTPSISVEIFLAREIHIAYHLSVPVISVFKSKSSFRPGLVITSKWDVLSRVISHPKALTSPIKRRRQMMIFDIDAGNYVPWSVPATERTNVGWIQRYGVGHYPSAIRRNTLVAPFFRFYVVFNFLHAGRFKRPALYPREAREHARASKRIAFDLLNRDKLRKESRNIIARIWKIDTFSLI